MAESALIDELLRQYGENPRRVFARLANEYRKQGDLTTAIEICRTQVPLQPTYISGYIVLGQALFESGQLDEARATFEAAIGLDPENLIALRQLGDIARMGGDLDGARSWYYRLLEVDPQNAEVAAHVRSLESAPPPSGDPSAGEQVSWSDINPERATPPQPIAPLPRLTLGVIPEDLSAEPMKQPEPAEMMPPQPGPVSPPAAAAAPADATPTMILDTRGTVPNPTLAANQPRTIERPVVPIAPPPAAVVPVTPPPPAAAPAPAVPRLSGLEITGLEELAQFSQPIAPPPAVPPAPMVPPPPAELPPLEAMTGEFTAPAKEDASFRAPSSPVEEEEPPLWSPPAITQEHVAQSPPAADSLRDTLSFPTPKNVAAFADERAAAPAPPAPAAVPPSQRTTDKRAGVDNWGSIDTAPPPAATSASEAPYDPTVGRMLDLGAGSGSEVPTAFMTETMAELYLQQGYTQEALQIYRQLAAMRPDDASLKERIARLEKGSRSSLSVAAQISEDVISAAQARGSKPAQTSRSFFGGLASKRAPTPPGAVKPVPMADVRAPVAPPPAPMAPVAPPAPVVPVAPPPAPVVPITPPPASHAASHAASAAQVASTPTEISSLFTDKAAAQDELAATALASAFVEETPAGTPTPAAGLPSRAASQPLSLDDVFRGQRPTTDAQRASPNVTFDEFFAPRNSGAMAAVDPSSPARPADGAPPEADLALFHEWLDGLKK